MLELGFFMFEFFFFQAEDGIRYATVTEVQTCALPIFARFDSMDRYANRVFAVTRERIRQIEQRSLQILRAGADNSLDKDLSRQQRLIFFLSGAFPFACRCPCGSCSRN